MFDVITAVDVKVTKLSIRLIGDDGLRTKGLVGEVSDIGSRVSNLEGEVREGLAGFRETCSVCSKSSGELDIKQNDRLTSLEGQNRDQAKLLEDLKLIRIFTDKIWKILAILAMAGLFNPFLESFIKKLFSLP